MPVSEQVWEKVRPKNKDAAGDTDHACRGAYDGCPQGVRASGDEQPCDRGDRDRDDVVLPKSCEDHQEQRRDRRFPGPVGEQEPYERGTHDRPRLKAADRWFRHRWSSCAPSWRDTRAHLPQRRRGRPRECERRGTHRLRLKPMRRTKPRARQTDCPHQGPCRSSRPRKMRAADNCCRRNCRSGDRWEGRRRPRPAGSHSTLRSAISRSEILPAKSATPGSRPRPMRAPPDTRSAENSASKLPDRRHYARNEALEMRAAPSECRIATIDHKAVGSVIGRRLAHEINGDASEIGGLAQAEQGLASGMSGPAAAPGALPEPPYRNARHHGTHEFLVG